MKPWLRPDAIAFAVPVVGHHLRGRSSVFVEKCLARSRCPAVTVIEFGDLFVDGGELSWIGGPLGKDAEQQDLRFGSGIGDSLDSSAISSAIVSLVRADHEHGDSGRLPSISPFSIL